VPRFEWDPRKARENLRKHGVSFEEAVTAFSDDEALLRFVLLGLSGALRLLTVVHCYRVDDEVIRVISARRATRSERVQYGARWMK